MNEAASPRAHAPAGPARNATTALVAAALFLARVPLYLSFGDNRLWAPPTPAAIKSWAALMAIGWALGFSALTAAGRLGPRRHTTAALFMLFIGGANLLDFCFGIAKLELDLPVSLTALNLLTLAAACVGAGVLKDKAGLPAALSAASVPLLMLAALKAGALRPVPGDTAPGVPSDSLTGPSAHLIVFDGLSAPAVLEPTGRASAGRDGFDEAASQALVFTDAHPPACDGSLGPRFGTKESLSGILSGRRVKGASLKGPGWEFTDCGGTTHRLGEGGSVIGDARAHGFTPRLFGFLLPYCASFGSSLDECSVPSAIRPVHDVVLPSFVTGLFSSHHRHHAAIHERNLARYLSALRRSHGKGFFLFHDNLPHPPYPYDDEGRVLTPLSFAMRRRSGPSGASSGYRNSVAAADRALASVTMELKSVGAFQAALIVVTSDHPPRQTASGASVPVPLLVKLPGAGEFRAVPAPASNHRLRALFQEFFSRGAVPPDRAEAILTAAD